MSRINKTDIIDYVSEEAFLSKRDATAALESIFEIIGDALVAGSEVYIPEFGKIFIKEKKSKKLVHPKTKQLMTIPPQKKVEVSINKNLKQRINGK